MTPSRIKLNKLLIVLIVFVAVALLGNSFYVSYHVQKKMLVDSTLEANHIYALKLAASTDVFLQTSINRLNYSAALLAGRFDDENYMRQEADRLQLDTTSFDSVVIVDAEGVVKVASPASLGIEGMRPPSEEVRRALNLRQTYISHPYVSLKNNLIISISSPIFKGEQYLGYIGAAIYLNKKNILYTLLGEHYYRDGSYIYVADSQRRLLYHPNKSRIGEVVDHNALLAHFGEQRDGSLQLTNSEGVRMLAGYAIIPSANWVIVAQRPRVQTEAPLDTLMLTVVHKTLPMAIVILLFVWWLAYVIAHPLGRLATRAQRMNEEAVAGQIQRVKAWYFEAAELKRAMLMGLGLLNQRISQLNHEAETDPMTGLYNRRSLKASLEAKILLQQDFSLISLDIDHFKRINDNYGHDAGDKVIKGLAQLMRACSRNHDALYRLGGEEFLMLLPDTPVAAAAVVAERLRALVEITPIDDIHMTISLGIVQWEPAMSVSDVLKAVDVLLYQAKGEGRNRVVV